MIFFIIVFMRTFFSNLFRRENEIIFARRIFIKATNGLNMMFRWTKESRWIFFPSFFNSSSLWCYGALLICFHKKLSPTMVDRLLILIWITFNNSVQKLTLIYHHIDFDRLGKLCSLINILMIVRKKFYT